MKQAILDRFRDPKIMGLFRHTLTAFGPVLAHQGIITEHSWQLYTGLVVAVLGFALSWTAKEKSQ